MMAMSICDIHQYLRKYVGTSGQLTVGKQLEGNDVDQTLQAVDSGRHADDTSVLADAVIVVVADDDCDTVISVLAAESPFGIQVTHSVDLCGQ
jgi:hypothetical protein